MTSIAQIAANKANAQKSTGPRSTQGKSLARLNAVKHGVNSSLPVLARGESRAKWDKFASAIIIDLDPAGPLEAVCAGRIALLQWQLLRTLDARRTIADQQYREAVVTAPQSPWWDYRRQTEKSLPESFEALRKCLRNLRRYRSLLARVVAFADNSSTDADVSPDDAVALIRLAAEHLGDEDELQSAETTGCFPGTGDLVTDAAPTDYDWKLSDLVTALTDVAGWSDLTVQTLVATLTPALKQAFNLADAKAKRAQRELSRFRRCIAARSNDEDAKFDKYERDLERRLALAMSEFRRLQQDRVRNSPANVLVVSPDHPQTSPPVSKPL